MKTDLEQPNSLQWFSLKAKLTVLILKATFFLVCVISGFADLQAQVAEKTGEGGGASVSVPKDEQLLAEVLSEAGEDGTRCDVADSLLPLLSKGGLPKTIQEIRALERQQSQVATAVAKCTVGVKIGAAKGCGVIITKSGYVLTAAHVAMRPGLQAELFLADGRVVKAKALGMNRSVDAGLMKIEPGQNNEQAWPHATLGTSDQLVPGMWCIATGHPGGYDSERGPVTRVGRILAVRDLAIVTDCALIGGDSGGPLFNLAGELIAVHSRIGNDVADNLHVPINHYADSWESMQQGKSWGYLPGFKPVLGVRGSPTSDKAVLEVVRVGSPAANAGLKEGDIVEEFGNKLLTDFKSLQDAVSDTMPGERVRLLINRNGRTRVIVVEIGRAG
ncbi:MAG: trypsin-like peptidase domain-containing protein [Rubripirellula sp.]